jgi:hypothetical protein
MTKSKYIKIRGKTLYKLGNHKIGYDTLIFNLQPATLCPNNLNGTCPYAKNNVCYELKCEKFHQRKNGYNNVIEYKTKQMKYWYSHNKEDILKDIQYILAKYPYIKYIRFNESGDLKTKLDIEKLIYIANNISIPIYTYTHSKKLIEKHKDLIDSKPNNLIINGSDFMIDNSFNLVYKKDIKDNMLLCKGNCRICNYCKQINHKTIYVIKH